MGAELHTARKFAEAQGFEISKVVSARRTYKGRHFAEVTEFVEAVRLANSVAGPIIVGNLLRLLRATPEKQMPAALASMLASTVAILDATTKQRLTESLAARMLSIARPAAQLQSSAIKLGLSRSKKLKVSPPENQAKAARGTELAMEGFLRSIRPVVDDIRASMPSGTRLTRLHLAAELNRRGIRTRQSKTWTPENAGRLLRQLALAK